MSEGEFKRTVYRTRMSMDTEDGVEAEDILDVIKLAKKEFPYSFSRIFSFFTP